MPLRPNYKTRQKVPKFYLIHRILISLQRVNKSISEMELKINYSPISLGKLRIWSSVHHSLKSMKNLGSDEHPTSLKDDGELVGNFEKSP